MLKSKELYKGEPKVTINLSDCSFSENSGSVNGVMDLIFIVGRFQTGHFYGFWSCNPCGRTKNQDKGWAVIDPIRMEIIDYCETCSLGAWCGDFNSWKISLKPQFGKMTKLYQNHGEQWKMDE